MSQLIPTCVTCQAPRPGTYCARCGEKRIRADDHTIRQVVGHVVESVTNANGKLIMTLRALLWQPGCLTADHLRGRRKPYLAPLQLFLFANLLFFLLHPLIGSNTLTTALNTHLHYTWHQSAARALVLPRLTQRCVTLEAYAPVFDAASVTQAKSLLILVVPIFALAVALLYGRKRPFVHPLIFALHFCTVWLFLICAMLALTNLSIRLLRTVSVFPSDQQVEIASLLLALTIMTAYLFQAARAVFVREAGWLTVAKALALGLAFQLSLQIYRCVLFFITFWST